MNSALSQLQEWYTSHCDGDWEHSYGVHISTLDNPGWNISINLKDTELEDVPFPELRENISDDSNGDNLDLDWLVCTKQGSQFSGNGGPRQLERLISIFLDWAREARLAQESAKLDPAAEQAIANEGLAAEVERWPPY